MDVARGPLGRGALFNRFFGEPAHGPPHVAGGASGPIGGCRNNNPVNDMTAPVSWLINDLDKVIKTKSTQSLFG